MEKLLGSKGEARLSGEWYDSDIRMVTTVACEPGIVDNSNETPL